MKHFGIYNSTRFIKRISSVSIVVLISTLTISSAKAEEDYLLRVDMSQGTTWDSSQAVPKIAKLKQLRYRIPQINPDLLIAQVVMDYPLENASSVLDSKWNLGIWIYGPTIYCLSDDSCTSILIVRPSYNQKSSIQILKKASDTAPTISDCPSNYAVSKNENRDSIIAFSMSISCLGITSTFASYVFSGYDIGLTPMPYQFTPPNYADNPYFQLAKQSYDKNGGREGLEKQLGLISEANEEFIMSVKNYIDSSLKQKNTLKGIVSKSKVISKSKKMAYLKIFTKIDSEYKKVDSQFIQIRALQSGDEVIKSTNMLFDNWKLWTKDFSKITNEITKGKI